MLRRRTTLAALCVFGLVACKKPSVDCFKAIDHATKVARPDEALPITPEKVDKITVVLQAHCKADKWDHDVLLCLSNAVDGRGLTGCFDLLEIDDQDALMKDLMPIVTKREGSAAR